MKIRAISTSTRLEHPCQFLLPLFDLKRFHPPGASNAIGQEKNDGHIDDAIDKTSVLTEVTPQTEIPQTEDSRAEVMINASWGLSESIVGGAVTPDTFIVCKSDLAVGQRVIADKQHMTVSTPGGTHEVDVPRFLRNEASLNNKQVIEMAKLAFTLEGTMEPPVDVECAYAGGELYLLQCRPITTLR